jgi:hypothetical protein
MICQLAPNRIPMLNVQGFSNLRKQNVWKENKYKLKHVIILIVFIQFLLNFGNVSIYKYAGYIIRRCTNAFNYVIKINKQNFSCSKQKCSNIILNFETESHSFLFFEETILFLSLSWILMSFCLFGKFSDFYFFEIKTSKGS